MSKQVEFTICNCGNPAGHTGAVWHAGQPIPEGVKLTEAQLVGMINRVDAKGAEISAVVTRCGCGDPGSHNGSNGPAGVCPKPRQAHELGLIGFTSKNPILRLAWALVGERRSTHRIREANKSATATP